MKVRAAPGIKVPKEDKPREYITDAEVVDVAETAYTLRRIADGDLVEITPGSADGAEIKTKKGTK